MNQIALPNEVSPQEIRRQSTLGESIALCAKVGGFAPKELQAELKTDKAQWSRWESGTEGIVWPKLQALMDVCGNDAPLLWMLIQRNYDITTLRKTEDAMQKENRELREENAALRRVLMTRAA